MSKLYLADYLVKFTYKAIGRNKPMRVYLIEMSRFQLSVSLFWCSNLTNDLDWRKADQYRTDVLIYIF